MSQLVIVFLFVATIQAEDIFNDEFDEECTAKADVVFMFDSSFGVSRDNFQKQKDLARLTINHLSVGPDRVQISVMTVNSQVRNQFVLKRYQTKGEVISAIDQVPYRPAARRRLSSALKMLTSQSFSASNGARQHVPHIAVLITNGPSSYKLQTIYQGTVAKTMNITMVTISVGPAVDMDELLFLTSIPHQKYHMDAEHFVTLPSLSGPLANKICNGSPDLITTAPTQYPTTGPDFTISPGKIPSTVNKDNLEIQSTTNIADLITKEYLTPGPDFTISPGKIPSMISSTVHPKPTLEYIPVTYPQQSVTTRSKNILTTTNRRTIGLKNTDMPTTHHRTIGLKDTDIPRTNPRTIGTDHTDTSTQRTDIKHQKQATPKTIHASFLPTTASTAFVSSSVYLNPTVHGKTSTYWKNSPSSPVIETTSTMKTSTQHNACFQQTTGIINGGPEILLAEDEKSVDRTILTIAGIGAGLVCVFAVGTIIGCCIFRFGERNSKDDSKKFTADTSRKFKLSFWQRKRHDGVAGKLAVY